MNLNDIIRERRSIRRFREKDVSQEVLDQVLEAVRWTPSGGNIQPWEVIVIRAQETKRRLQETLGKGNPGRKAMLEAPLLIALCGKVKIPETYRHDVVTKFGDGWFLFHLGSAAQNLCLAAHALNLGTLMVGFFDHDRAAEILEVPEGYEVLVLIPLGYPARIPSPPTRREQAEFVHQERFLPKKH